MTGWKKYTSFNTEKTTNATNSFEKHIFKLMIDSVYGKKNGKVSMSD